MRNPDTAMSDDVTDWKEFREFTAVDLEQSFVVAWRAEGESLLIDLDLLLSPEHAFYEKPRPAEGACFRQAVIEFPSCTQIIEPGKDSGGKLADAIESLDAGRVAGLRRAGDGYYEITGEFGTVGIHAERPLLRLIGQLA
jgi:hypothetical protein